MSADLILHHGKVITVDGAFSIGEALAIEGDRFLGAGSNDEVEALAGPNTKRVNLNGRSVMPGIFDGHAHAMNIGVNLSKVGLTDATSIDDVLGRVAAKAREAQPGEWIEGSPQWHETSLAERRFPTRQELDRAAPNNPVYLPRGTRFFAAANSAALALAGINRNTPDPPEGRFERDDQGELTGMMFDPPAFDQVLKLLPPLDFQGKVAAVGRVNRAFNEIGITSTIDPALTAEDFRAYQRPWERHEMTVRTTGIVAPDRSVPLQSDLDELVRFLEGWAPRSGFGDDFFRVGPFKVWVDGFIETAWFHEGYANNPEFHGVRGVSYDVLRRLMKKANELDWQVALHAVGDAAIEMALDAYAEADAEQSIRDKRWTLMHALFPTPKAIEQCRQMGICISVQQGFSYAYGETMAKLWGPKRAAYATPHRTWLDAGFRPAGGSDVMPYNPFTSMWSIITRDTKTAGVLGPEQAATRQEAIEMYTINPCYLTFEENVKGSIEPGKLADCVVLSDDPLTCEAGRIKDLTPLATIVGGRLVHGQIEDL